MRICWEYDLFQCHKNFQFTLVRGFGVPQKSWRAPTWAPALAAPEPQRQNPALVCHKLKKFENMNGQGSNAVFRLFWRFIKYSLPVLESRLN